MAIYVSRYARQRINMMPKDMGIKKIGKHEFPRVMPELTVQFRDCRPGFPTDALPTDAYEDGRAVARGIFNTDTDFPKKAAAEWDVTEDELIEFLDTHNQNVANDGPGAKLFARVDNLTDSIPEDSFLKNVGDDRVECLLCERVIERRGLANHLTSRVHTDLAEKAEAEALSA